MKSKTADMGQGSTLCAVGSHDGIFNLTFGEGMVIF